MCPASVEWGDGTTDTAFRTFSDARNGATGQLRDAYVYGAPGTYEIVATITDDDDGATAVSFTIQVLSIEQAITDVVQQIDVLLSTATDPKAVAALLDARDELTGNHGGTPPTNGALDLLDADDPVGAITKLSAALAFLMTAESSGAGDLRALTDLLGLAAEGIATTAYYEATVAIPNPSRGQAADAELYRPVHRHRARTGRQPSVQRRLRELPSGDAESAQPEGLTRGEQSGRARSGPGDRGPHRSRRLRRGWVTLQRSKMKIP